MKLIRLIKAWHYGVPNRKKEWYNFMAMCRKEERAEYNMINIWDENGKYINCPKIGGTVTYLIKGVPYLYKVVGFKDESRYRDWLYDTDYINPIIEFVKKL